MPPDPLARAANTAGHFAASGLHPLCWNPLSQILDPPLVYLAYSIFMVILADP